MINSTGSFNQMPQTGKIKDLKKKSQYSDLSGYDPITTMGTKKVLTPELRTEVIKKRIKPPRDIPFSGINERAMFLRKHPKGAFKTIKRQKKFNKESLVNFTKTDVGGSKKKFGHQLAMNMKKFQDMESSAKADAAKRRSDAQNMYNAGSGKLKESYAQRGLGKSGLVQEALKKYGETSGFNKQLQEILSGEKKALGSISSKRAMEQSKYGAALKKLGGK